MQFHFYVGKFCHLWTMFLISFYSTYCTFHYNKSPTFTKQGVIHMVISHVISGAPSARCSYLISVFIKTSLAYLLHSIGFWWSYIILAYLWALLSLNQFTHMPRNHFPKASSVLALSTWMASLHPRTPPKTQTVKCNDY